MNDKKNIFKKETSKKTTPEITSLIEKKINFFQDIIQKTVIHVQQNKNLDIISVSDVNNCINNLFNINNKIKDIYKHNKTTDSIINSLQEINNELSSLFKTYGTELFEDLLWICFGNNSVNTYAISDMDKQKFELLKKYFHPTGYKLLSSKNENENEKPNKIEDHVLNEKSKNLDCVDIAIKTKQFYLKVYGIQIIIHNPQHKKSLIITGLIDEAITDFLNNQFINLKYQSIKENSPNSPEFQNETFTRFIKSLSLKDYIILETHEIYAKFIGYLSNLKMFRQKTITQSVKDFISSDLFTKRNTLIQLLIKFDNYDNHYLAYLLYDLLSNDVNGSIDTQDQIIIFDSFPWSIKQYFKDAMKSTVQYTNDLLNFNIQKIPLEQQICLLKVPDSVKEKAMQKLKEIKAKSEDSGSKARQYLDGLLKIPFNIFKREPILNTMNDIKTQYIHMLQKHNIINTEIKNNYTNLEILTNLKKINDSINNNYINIEKINDKINNANNNELKHFANKINNFITQYKLNNIPKLKLNKKMDDKREDVLEFLKVQQTNKTSKGVFNNLITDVFDININSDNNEFETKNSEDLLVCLNAIKIKYDEINTYMINVKSTLDNAVYGHDKAKKQIERIIGQWINGSQDGYCFGFEGPPGVGKCFAKNTQIMLFDGRIELVQNINIGDKLMGDDGLERNVLSLGSGNEYMYKINQSNGESYTVNESHILSLKIVDEDNSDIDYYNIYGKKYFIGDTIDIDIVKYLNLPDVIKRVLKGYKVDLEFCEIPVEICPIMFGSILGKLLSQNNLSDFEITILNTYNLFNNAHIPDIYKFNSQNIRFKLLSGLIKTYSSYNNNTIEFKNINGDNKVLAYDILWLVRSLGVTCSIKKDVDICNEISNNYYQLIISGNKVQSLKENNFMLYSKEKCYDKELYSDIIIQQLYIDRYYGFYIDGNSRFLLGDFTVAHNTSLAKKGLADCLKDADGVSRPFSMIQMGGDANGSSLHGHNYTYVGSTWGSIVQILIDKKCMNPIIFIDEIDKISKTEHGREIIGILTHLLDPAQNDCFQDKYFSGIDLDLSKALFILSYNDAEAIDKILLDRVHRVKFKSLTLEEKIVISKQHILPEVYNKMGLQEMITFSDDVLKFIIDEYTLESGVRKLKEILFEIVGEVNLDILKNFDTKYEIPIDITIDDIKTKYFKDKQEIKHKKIHKENKIGIINGLWANALGKGGVIPIQTTFRPSDYFLQLYLTGMQGDVMKESMNVASSLAWKLTPNKIKGELQNKEANKKGLHIHCPEGATPKDGPSAGTAITTAIYSLLNNKKIKYNIAITGEITLDGNITEIGGLDLKFLGGIKAGVTEFLYPKENTKDYDNFMEKYKDDEILKGIKFNAVEKIDEVFELVFE